MKIGDKVYLRKDSKYWVGNYKQGQDKKGKQIDGEIINLSTWSDFDCEVEWSDGTEQLYQYVDLELIPNSNNYEIY